MYEIKWFKFIIDTPPERVKYRPLNIYSRKYTYDVQNLIVESNQRAN